MSSYNENTLPAGGTLKKEHNLNFGSSMITLDVTGNEDEVERLYFFVFWHLMVSWLIFLILNNICINSIIQFIKAVPV